MKKQKFESDDDGYINGVTNETTLIKEGFNLPMGYVEVLVTEEKDSKGIDWFNLYIIDDRFIKDPMNCLKEQIPKAENQTVLNEMFLEMKALEHYLWFKYSSNNDTLGFSVECYKD